ncbi:hypothetical protein ACIBM4_21355 [Streptomyces sp. NPDC050256]|uniref:hypothetical protein n=1 Tax=Streptomyces sp. NPDC050256 TaxID=3365607 RepID=UPI0013A49D8A|nr:hypothetical protein EAO72_39450 [Streptomyces sp. or43]
MTGRPQRTGPWFAPAGVRPDGPRREAGAFPPASVAAARAQITRAIAALFEEEAPDPPDELDAGNFAK